MSGAFDPYYSWLGIAPPEQPPDHYRLLGLPRFTISPQIIDTAADRQIAHLHSLQLPPQAIEIANRLVEHIQLARHTLLNPDTRAAYDAHLRIMLGMAVTGPPVAPAAAPDYRLGPPPGYQAAPPAMYAPAQVPPPPPAPQLTQPVELNFAAPTPSPTFETNTPASARPTNGNRPAKRPPPSAIGRLIAVLVPTSVTVGLLLMFPKWFGKKNEPETVNEPSRSTASLQNGNKSATPDPAKKTGNDPLPWDVTPNPPQPPVEPIRPNPPDNSAGTDPTKPDPGKMVEPPTEPNPPKTEPSKPAGPRDVPTEAEIAKARKLLEDLFGADIAAAKKQIDKIALAEKLLRESGTLKAQPHEFYAVLTQVRDLAIEGGSPELVNRAVLELAVNFKITLAAERLAGLTKVAEKITVDTQQKTLATVALDAANDAATDDDYETAIALARIAHNAAQLTSETKLKQTVLARGKELVTVRTAYQAYQAGLEKLEQSPEDGDANLAVGRWLCFVKQEFSLGAPHLIKSSDVALVELVKREGAETLDADATLAIADGWWDLASQRETSPDRINYLRRARMWYEKAAGSAAGLAKVKVAKRLEELPKLLPETAPKAVGASGTGLGSIGTALKRDAANKLLNGPYEVTTREATTGLRRKSMWVFNANSVEATDDSGGQNRLANWEPGATGRLLLAQRPQFSITLYSTEGEEFTGAIAGDDGVVTFQLTGKRIRNVGRLKMTITAPGGSSESVDYTMYSDGGLAAPFHRTQRWAVQGTKLIYQTPKFRGVFMLSADKKSFASKQTDGRSIKGTIEWTN